MKSRSKLGLKVKMILYQKVNQSLEGKGKYFVIVLEGSLLKTLSSTVTAL